MAARSHDNGIAEPTPRTSSPGTAYDVQWTFGPRNAKLSRVLEDRGPIDRHSGRLVLPCSRRPSATFGRSGPANCRPRAPSADLPSSESARAIDPEPLRRSGMNSFVGMQVDEEVRPCPWKSA